MFGIVYQHGCKLSKLAEAKIDRGCLHSPGGGRNEFYLSLATQEMIIAMQLELTML